MSDGEQLSRLWETLGYYFDFEVDSWDEGACPEPEDVWRLHRDLQAILGSGETP